MGNITGTEEGDILDGTSGDDQISALGGFDLVYGEGGNDTIDGGDGWDTIYGDGIVPGESDGNDTINGGAGYDDTVDGGAGIDTLYFDARDGSAGITADFSQLTSGGTIVVAGATLTGIESVVSIDGTDFADAIVAGFVREGAGIGMYGWGGD